MTGGAAAYAVYVIIKAVNSQPQPSLRRSNAIHRHQRPQINIPQDAQQGGGREDNEDATSIAGTDLSYHSGLPGDDDDSGSGDEHALRQITYHIAEERAMNEGMEHHFVTCDQCGATPIRGIRWRCTNCSDFDLCSDCEATNMHDRTHIFEKIRVSLRSLTQPRQIQPIMYPGRPEEMAHSVDMVLKRMLASDLNISHETVDAYWQKFTLVANTPYPDDPNGVGWAINRQAFDSAFMAGYSSSVSKPNQVYDRIFSMLDSNDDGFIGFAEFMMYFGKFHKRDNIAETKMEIAFHGFDVRGDGFVGRQDVLRIIRSFYRIQKDSVQDYIYAKNQELSIVGALDTIESSKPLNSVFTVTDSDDSTARRMAAKTPDGFGDLQPPSGDETVVLENESTDMTRNEFLNKNFNGNGQNLAAERWQRKAFYLDEEEGLIKPPEWDYLERQFKGLKKFMNGTSSPPSPISPPVEKIPDLPVSAAPSTSPRDSQVVSRTSRSSSRVRFDDDVQDMDDNRSTTSTASRPRGERWGGYQLPDPEIDIGQDVMYQLIQDAMNTLLDPLFQHTENLSVDVVNTEQERAISAPVIDLYERSMSSGQVGRFSNIFLDYDLKASWEVAVRAHFDTWLLPLAKLVDPSHRLFRRAFTLIPNAVERLLRPDIALVQLSDPGVSDTIGARYDRIEALWAELFPTLLAVEPDADGPERRFDPLGDIRVNSYIESFLRACDSEYAPKAPYLNPMLRTTIPPYTQPKLLSWVQSELAGVPTNENDSDERIEALRIIQRAEPLIEERGGPGRLSLEEYMKRITLIGGEIYCLSEWLDVAFF